MINWPWLREFTPRFLGISLIVAIIIYGCNYVSKEISKPDDVVMLVVHCVIFSLCVAAVFIPMFIKGISERFTSFLLYPKKILKETPPALSTAMRHLSRRELDDAEQELLKVFESHPDNTTAALLLMELYCEDRRAPDKAVILAERYYTENRNTPGEENYRILLLACDQYQHLGLSESALELLRQELPKECYSAHEKSGIERRISALSH